jgi:hypothetical protein
MGFTEVSPPDAQRFCFNPTSPSCLNGNTVAQQAAQIKCLQYAVCAFGGEILQFGDLFSENEILEKE